MSAWVLARLREPSTWRGIIWLATACGIALRPEVWEHVTAVGIALAGLLGVLTSEAPRVVEIKLPEVRLPGETSGRFNDTGSGIEPTEHGAIPSDRSGFGVRPPVERPLGDNFSGGWGDR